MPCIMCIQVFIHVTFCCILAALMKFLLPVIAMRANAELQLGVSGLSLLWYLLQQGIRTIKAVAGIRRKYRVLALNSVRMFPPTSRPRLLGLMLFVV